MVVRWTEPAVRDRTRICDYSEGRFSVSVARRVALSIEQRIGGLSEFPESGRSSRNSGTRERMLAPLPYVAFTASTEIRILHRGKN
jgi:plasmid stabilization system protein ParE